jgi:outer membrane receptor protein involved in Fe transport
MHEMSPLTRSSLVLAVGAVACLAWIAPAAAQESRGAITGRVTDASGAVVPGVAVSATHAATNLSVNTHTDLTGNFNLLYLPAGRYTVTAELSGFKKVVRGGIDVRVGDRLTLNLTIEPGAVAETVEVTASTPLLEASTGSSGQVVDAKRIALLPLSDGNPFVLSRMAPGAAYVGDLKFSRPFDNAGTSSITVDGASGGNEFTLDGSPNMAHGRRVAYVPPSDAVEEFKVETATYDAQQGHTAGGTVNVVMKSGTNKLRGTLYEFYRDESMNANDFFLNRSGKPRGLMSYHRFGGSLGGPVVLPRYNGKDRTFFFIAYEGLYDQFPEPRQDTVPTEAMRRGDFSALLSQGIIIYNPFSAVRRADGRIERQPFPGNIVPGNLMNPVARAYLNLFPLPNQPGDAQGRNNFISDNPRSDDFNSISTRIDHRLSDRHRFFVRYSWNDRRESRNIWTGEVGGVMPSGNYLYRVNHAFTYDHVYSHSSSSLVNLRVGFSRFEEPNVRPHQGIFDPKSLGFSARTASFFGDASYVPRFEVGGLTQLGDSIGNAQYTNVYSVQPTLTKIMGNHSVRLGYDFRMYRFNRLDPGHAAGFYEFGTDFTRGPLDTASGAPVGQQFAAFLLGLPTGQSRIERNASLANQSLYHGVFVQDDWKVTPKLTLNIGLRYDYEGAATERFDRMVAGFDTGAQSPISARAEAAYAARPMAELPASAFQVRGGLKYPSEGDRALWRADGNNIQPRFGFAFQASDKTVIRGGWAIYTVPNLLDSFNQSGFSQSTPIVTSLDTGLTFRANLTDPFPDGVLDPAGASQGAGTFMGQNLGDTDRHVFLDGTRKNEQSMRWSIGFQRELPGQWVFEAAYVGNRGSDLVLQSADGRNLRNYVDINGVPAPYLSRSPVRDQNQINFLNANVPNPFQGLIPGTGLNGATTTRLQLLRPFPQFLAVRTERRGGTSRYHAAQFRLEKRFTGHFTVLGGYTWSRFREKTILLNPTDAEPSETPAEADVPHRFVGSAIWELPFGKDRRFNLGRLGNALLGGWSVQGIYNWQSGRPIRWGNLYFNGDPTKLKANYDDPDHIFDTSGFYFGDAAVQTGGSVDPAKQRGDQRIRLANNIRTFPFRLANLRWQNVSFFEFSMIKTVRFTEDVRMQLRFEAFNALNHPIFDVDQAETVDPTNATFGKVTQQFNIPRNVQLGVRLFF